jgi:hypothetical protein
MSLQQIIYTSHSLARMSSEELVELLEKSRRNNTAMGITGLLLHADGSFMQTIEGEPSAVRQLFDRIYEDERHDGIITIADERVEHRSFSDWSMAFREITRDEAATIPGFLKGASELKPVDRNLARSLMQTFFRTSRFSESR